MVTQILAKIGLLHLYCWATVKEAQATTKRATASTDLILDFSLLSCRKRGRDEKVLLCACPNKTSSSPPTTNHREMDLTPVSEISSTTEYEEESEMLGIVQAGKTSSTLQRKVKLILSRWRGCSKQAFVVFFQNRQTPLVCYALENSWIRRIRS